MYSVVNEINGTTFSSKLPGIQKMAGKTGTSQVRKISLEEKREKDGVIKNEDLVYKAKRSFNFYMLRTLRQP